MAYCEKCGAQLAEGAKFCPSCGAQVGAAQAAGNTQNVDLGATFQNINNTEDTTQEFDPADIQQNKTMAVLAYIGILVLVPLLGAKGSKFARFHANQGLVLLIAEIILTLVQRIVSGVLLSIFWGSGLMSALMSLIAVAVWVFSIVMMILGIVNAANGRAKQLPLIGNITLLK